MMTELKNAIETLKEWLPIAKSQLPTEAHEAYEVLHELTEGFTDFSDVSAFPEFETLLIEFAEKLELIMSKAAVSPKKKEASKKGKTAKPKLDKVERLVKALKVQIEFLRG